MQTTSKWHTRQAQQTHCENNGKHNCQINWKQWFCARRVLIWADLRCAGGGLGWCRSQWTRASRAVAQAHADWMDRKQRLVSTSSNTVDAKGHSKKALNRFFKDYIWVFRSVQMLFSEWPLVDKVHKHNARYTVDKWRYNSCYLNVSSWQKQKHAWVEMVCTQLGLRIHTHCITYKLIKNKRTKRFWESGEREQKIVLWWQSSHQ